MAHKAALTKKQYTVVDAQLAADCRPVTSPAVMGVRAWRRLLTGNFRLSSGRRFNANQFTAFHDIAYFQRKVELSIV